MMSARGARSLTVESGKSPALDRGHGPEVMSMPPLADELLSILVLEVFESEFVGAADADYTDGDGNRFAVKGAKGPSGLRLVFSLVGSSPSASVAAPSARPRSRPTSVAPPPPTPGHIHIAADPVRTELSGAAQGALALAQELGGSDILLSVDLGVRVRVGGQFQSFELDIASADIESILAFGGRAAADSLTESGSCDFALDLRASVGQRFRVNVFRQHRGLAAALRPIRLDIPTLSELRLPDRLRELALFPHGLVLVAGQAGSGKSTTLAALVQHLNTSVPRHVITLEDPIEYEYVPQRAIVHQREVGTHLSSFASGLRAALRESPDVILLGEMRDRDTIAAALTAAETGHLVLSTLHAASAEMALDRVIDIFPEGQQQQVRAQLANVLRATLTQFLLPATSPPGRVPAYELMIVNAAIAAMIREGKSHQIQSQIQTGRDAGMVPLDRVLRSLIKERAITLQSARAIAREPAALGS